jgi:hypothetical protein
MVLVVRISPRGAAGWMLGVWGNAITVLEGWVNGPSVSGDTHRAVRGSPGPGRQGRRQRQPLGNRPLAA